MTDHWGNGRWGAGSRPNQPGMDQSNYDIGAQQRQREHFRQLEENRRRLEKNFSNHPSQPAPTYQSPSRVGNYGARAGDGDFFVNLVKLGFIGACWWAALALWGVTVDNIYTTNATALKVIEMGGYGAGALGILSGYLLRRHIFKILKIITIFALVLFVFVMVAGFLLETFDPEWAR